MEQAGKSRRYGYAKGQLGQKKRAKGKIVGIKSSVGINESAAKGYDELGKASFEKVSRIGQKGRVLLLFRNGPVSIVLRATKLAAVS